MSLGSAESKSSLRGTSAKEDFMSIKNTQTLQNIPSNPSTTPKLSMDSDPLFIPIMFHSSLSALEPFAYALFFISLFSLWLRPGGVAWALCKVRACNLIPGPPGYPLIGSMSIFTASAPHRVLAKLARSLNAKPLLSLSVGFTRFVISSNPETAKEVLNSSAFANRPRNETAYELLFNRAMGFAPYGEYWRNLRRIAATHLFSPKRIAGSEGFRIEMAMWLETFKRQLMQSLNDDNSSPARTVDIGTCDQAVPKAYPDKDEETNGYSAQYSSTGSTDMGSTTDEALRNGGPTFSLTPYITPRLTPTATPKVFSTTGSPRAYSTIPSPQQTSGATSPTKSYDGQNSVSSWYPSSRQSSAANSPPRGRPLSGRTPRIDGKEFFRQARSRLSYEQFSAFLANIKELNAEKQTREETLRKAEEILGTDNKDLYLSFQGLLNRNIH
ncbi:hypothetical protein ACLB2K_028675 [Fragaria x ananassa]